MKSQFPALLMVGALAAWNTDSSVAQVGHSAATPMQVWNHTSQGMSTNAALAFYRVQNVGRPTMQTPGWPRYSQTPAVTSYPLTSNTANAYYPATAATQVRKPFTYVRPPATAFDRYWPYLMEAREDPDTGFIIWTLP